MWATAISSVTIGRVSERRRYSVVRDPVHGDVYLSDEELRLVDTPQMQRLRGVRQLGTAYLVYPGAQHTRFEHSLGTMHLTSRLVAAVNQNKSLRPDGLAGIAPDEERMLRAAALVHDVTHIPSGHNIEDVRGILDRHDSAERYQQALSPATDVGAALEKMGIRREVLAVLLPDGGDAKTAATAASAAPVTPKQAELFDLVFEAFEQLRRQDFSPIWGSMVRQQVKRQRPGFNEGDYGFQNFTEILEAARKAGRIEATLDRQSGQNVVTAARRAGEAPAPAAATPPPLPTRTPACWRELLSDTICPDILDYLKRDAYFTGLSLVYDERILSYFMVDRASGHLFVDVEKRGMLREDILSELLRVLDARYFFSERVYYHHAKVAAGAMVAQVVESALLHGGLTKEQLYDQTDHSLIGLLERHLSTPGLAPGGAAPAAAKPDGEAAEELARARELLTRLKSRQLLKRACVYPLYANREVQEELLERFFAPGRHGERKAFERELREELRRAGFSPPLIQLYCPARRMQLKEAATHVRFPGADGIAPLAKFADRVPRLADLEKSYRDLWKLYLFAGSDDPALLSKIAEIAAKLLPKATNVYRLKP
jgi:HD superfamily phosphohydrolase